MKAEMSDFAFPEPCNKVAGNQYVHAATSDNTRIAYQGDIVDFLKKWTSKINPPKKDPKQRGRAQNSPACKKTVFLRHFIGIFSRVVYKYSVQE